MLIKDLRTKDHKELNGLIEELKAQLFLLRFQNSTGQLEQPHKISAIKKDIAKIFTILNEKDKQSNTKKVAAKPKKVKEAVKEKAVSKETSQKNNVKTKPNNKEVK